MRVGEYLLQRWLPAIQQTIRPTTYSGYTRHIRGAPDRRRPAAAGPHTGSAVGPVPRPGCRRLAVGGLDRHAAQRDPRPDKGQTVSPCRRPAGRDARRLIALPRAGVRKPADRHRVVNLRRRDHVGHVCRRTSHPCSKSMRMTTRRRVGRLTSSNPASSKTCRAPTCASPHVICLPGWVIIG